MRLFRSRAIKNVTADGAEDGGGHEEGEVRMMMAAGWLKRRHEVVACLVVLLHYDFPKKHPSPLPQHVEVELRKQWDVGQHDDDEAVVIVEGNVILVGEPHGVHSRSAYEWQSSINGQQFPDDSQRVQDDEEVVSGPFDEVRQVMEQVECVVGISGNLCHRPHHQE